jgi:hypothetical protein
MSKLAIIAVLVAGFALQSLAQAKGTMRVQQSDGSVQLYNNVNLAVAGRALKITTADKKGTLIVDDAACSLVEAIMSCIPDRVRLQQNGTHDLDFARGTIYFNTTDSRQQLKYSSTQLPPSGILGTLISQRGTYVTLTGTLDSTSK